MKANELRIGNYITTSYLNKITFKVNGIHSNKINYVGINVNYNGNTIPEYIEPIQLTEEWLLRFGFEIKNDICTIDCIVFELILDDDFRLILSNINIITEPLCFVHQLQNLYFALTGEELTLKQPTK